MTSESFGVRVPLSLEPLRTTDAHDFWRVFLSGRSDVPTADLRVHLDRFLSLSADEQRAHFAAKKDGRIIGTVRLGPSEISGFSVDPNHADDAVAVLLKAIDLLRSRGAGAITGQFEDRYESTFTSLGFRPLFARMRMEAPTRTGPPAAGVVLQPPEEGEVARLTAFLKEAYEGHLEQRYGMHVGTEEEWRGYVAGLLKGDSGRFMPDASYVDLEGGRIFGAILVTHWMGMPLVAELAVAADHRRRGIGRALLVASMGRLAGLGESRIALYVTLGNDPAIALYRSQGFVQVGGRSVTTRLEA